MKKAILFLATFLIIFYLAPSSFAFLINSGYYVGKGVAQSITGVGFKPDLVIIKADIGNYAVFRTSAMSDAQGTAYFAPNAENFANGITSLDNDGFTVGTNPNVNAANVRYTWVAFKDNGASDFKVGSYTGDGQNNHSITGVGFRPDLVIIKGNRNSYGCWKTSTMTGEVTQFFYNSNQLTSNLIRTLEADGFQVGISAEVNSSSGTYWYIAFKEVTGKLKVGSYEGNGSDDRSITGIGFKPDFVFLKGANNTTAQYGVLRSNQSYGDESQIFSNFSNTTNEVQSLEADGFQVGSSARVNENGKIYFYAAFGGVPTPETPTGNFTMASGSYLGKGSSQQITSSLSFTPDLVIVKSGSNNYAVFSTSQMPPGYSAYFAGGGMTTGAITIKPNGFEVGSDPNVNASGTYYYWTAFGNSGCSNFKIGAFSGNGLDNRSIPDVGFQPDLVTVKRYTTNVACWRSSAMSGDTSAYFYNAANASNLIQALESNGFQVGTDAAVNALNNTYFYFAFKETPGYFKAGSYTGNGSASQTISSLGGRPNWVWVKSQTTTSYGFHKGLNLGENVFAQYFYASANVSDRITALGTNEFTVGSSNDTNQSGVNFWYAAWLSTPTSLKFTVQPTGAEVGNPIVPAPRVAVVDQYGNTVTYDNSTQITLSLSSNPGGATLSGTLTKTVVSGEAVFDNLSLDKSGNGYVLQASASGFASVNSNAFNIGAGQGNKLSFITQPTTTSAGSIISPPVQVAVKDTLGNIVTFDNATQITLALQNNPTGATLSGTLTRTASQGVATFDDLSLNYRGTGYTFLATAPYMQPATSEAFEVTAEAISPSLLSYFPSGEGVSREAKIRLRFSKAMDQTSVENAFSLTAVRNNLGNSINFPVSGTFSWISPEVVEFSPSSLLEYNYTYQVAISREAKDSVGNHLANDLSFIFTTVSSSDALNSFVGEDGRTRLTLSEGAVGTNYYARISISPESYPIESDPSKISAADTKVEAEKNKFKFRIPGSAREFVLYSASGERITSLKSSATITLPYSDTNGDGYVDGTNARVDALRICRLDENNNLWVIYPESILDPSAKTVSTYVRGLSTFALMALPATTLSQAYAFPNPFKPSLGHITITFTNLASECTIKIYTLAGDLVKTLVENDGNREYVWDVKNEAGENLASGLYFYVIKSADDTKTGKLVIIR